jgi:CRP/FNR family transcriptional regulator, cyclic AMP receptor protein
MHQSTRRPDPATNHGAAASGALLDVRRIRLLLGRSPHANSLPGKFLDRLARLGRIERYKGGELIHAAWQPLDKLWVVLFGGLRVTQLGEDGNALVIAVLGEGSYYGAGSLVQAGEVVRSEAHAVGATQVAAFDLRRLDQEFAGDRQMTQHRLQLLHRRLLATIDLAGDVLSVPLPQRMARRLLGQALAAGRGPEIELRVSQADLAVMLGTGRSKVNAALRRLEASGAVRLGYRKITVRDLESLRAAAGVSVMPL